MSEHIRDLTEAARIRSGGDHHATRLLVAGWTREGNHWGDQEWGATLDGNVWFGENLLGTLLMQRRNQLKGAS